MIGKSDIASALVVLGLLVPPFGASGQVVEEEDSKTTSPVPSQRAKPDLEQVAKQIVEKTNEFRREQKRQKVETNPLLTDAARYFAHYLAKTDKFSHTADEKQPSVRAKEHRYEYCFVSENIAYQENRSGFTAEGLSDGFLGVWNESPEHRKNMLDPDVTDTGIAVARSEKTGKSYAVAMFGRPKSKSIAFAIANESDAPVQYRIAERKFSLPPGYTRTHQECRPTDVAFIFPSGENAKGKTRTVKPSNGDQFVIQDEGQLRVEKSQGKRLLR